jgi:2-polyprenyl-3-methyl-5-hydroxy-6-metoxy-1,4-benzoquinol methylase
MVLPGLSTRETTHVAEVTYRFDTKVLSGRLDRTKEQIVPGHDSRYWLEFHLAFYRYARFRAKGADVLDIGCGYGYGSHLLSEEAESVAGIDFHPPAVAYAKEHYVGPNLSYQEHDANNPLPFEDNSFDLVVSSEVIEHIQRQKELVEEIARVGRPGGHVIVKTPNIVNDPGGVNPHHDHIFSLDELRDLMTAVFPRTQVYLWCQKIQTRDLIVEFPLSEEVREFGDPNPSDKAVLLYTQTVPELVEPVAGGDNPRGDLLAVCTIGE